MACDRSVFGFWAQMEEPYYSNVEYIDWQYLPVVLKDYEGTSDRPGCEVSADAEHFPEQVSKAGTGQESPKAFALRFAGPHVQCNLMRGNFPHSRGCPCVHMMLQGALISCNLRIKDLVRMSNIVSAAMMRWAASISVYW